MLLLSSVLSVALWAVTQLQGPVQAEQFGARALELARSGHFAQAEAELRRALVVAPDNPQLLGDLGAILGTEGKLTDAVPYLEKAVQIEPENVVLRCNLAATEFNLGEERRAEQNLKYVLRRQPGDRQATLLLGMVSTNLKEYRQAVALFESVPGLVKERPQAVAALARCYYHTGKIIKGRQLLVALLKPPEDPQEIFLAAQMAEEARDGPTAERLFNSIRSTYPDLVRLDFHLADAEYESGQYAESRNLLEQLIRSGHGTSEVFNLLGRCYAEEGQMARARNALETAIALRPSEEANYSDLTKILLAREELPAALVAAKWWTATFPSSYHAISMKADIEMKLQYYKQAANSYEQAVKLSPSSEAAALGLAKAEAAARWTSQAEKAFQNGIRRFPNAEPLYREYGKALLQLSAEGAPGAKHRGAMLLETAVRLDSSDWEARYLLGNLLLNEGKARLALPELMTAAHLSPKEGKVRFALWRAYSKLGMNAQARTQLEMFRQLQHAAPPPRAFSNAH